MRVSGRRASHKRKPMNRTDQNRKDKPMKTSRTIRLGNRLYRKLEVVDGWLWVETFDGSRRFPVPVPHQE